MVPLWNALPQNIKLSQSPALFKTDGFDGLMALLLGIYLISSLNVHQYQHAKSIASSF